MKLRWPHRAERDLRDEFSFHESMAAHAGRAPDPAGDLWQEQARDVRPLRWLEDLGHDLRLALRRFRHAPGFTAVAIVTLALGIGANTAIFTLVDALLLRPLPVPHAQQLVMMGNPEVQEFSMGIAGHEVNSLTYAQFASLRTGLPALSGLAGFAAGVPTTPVHWGDTTDASVPFLMVSGNFFRVLEVDPSAGHFFDSDTAYEAVLGYDYWRQKFAGKSVIGRTVRVGNGEFTIVGVAPRGFQGVIVGKDPALYLPMACINQILPGNPDLLHEPAGERRFYWVLGLGRLRPGATAGQASAQAAVIFARSITAQAAAAPDGKFRADILAQRLPVVAASRGASGLRSIFARPAWILLALVGLVLLVVIVNLGGMLLAQAAARQREFALRQSLGASRARLIRQMLTESLLLAVIGGALGWLVAQWGERLLAAMVVREDAGVQLALGADPRILGFTAAICLLAGVGFGLAPALRLSSTRLAQPSARAARHRAPGALVIAQVALAVVLVTGAALFVRSLAQLRDVPLGFNPSGLQTFTLNPTAAGASGAQSLAIFDRVAARLRQLPGVEAVTYSYNGLFAGNELGEAMLIPGDAGQVGSGMDMVAPGYFAALGIAMRRGREFTAADQSHQPGPLLINQAFADKYFSGRDPVGQLVQVEFTDATISFEVVGVTAQANEQNPHQKPDQPLFYLDLQNGRPAGDIHEVYFLVRASRPLRAPEVSRQVAFASGLALPVPAMDTIASSLDATLAPDVLLVEIAGFFGVLALGLAAMGLYAMLSYAVARQRAEIGIRMALGARAAQVTASVLRQALVLLAVGVAIGIAASLLLGRSLAALLFDVQPTDPVSLAVSAGLLLAAGLSAALIPALRASRTDPARTLRAE